MKIIGLTGPTGSGKSTVAKYFNDLGVEIIDCDLVAREVTEIGSELLPLLAETFGDEILADDGSLIRKELAKRAFSSESETKKLNSIMLPFIANKIKETLDVFATEGVECVMLDAPTLYESGLDSICDSVLAVLCDRETRKKRIIERDSLTEEQALTRLSAGKPDSFYKEKTQHIVVNDGEMAKFMDDISKMFGELV
ncbi:MAG: dephospho-CoA kinase [Clostridia bacterium]|nr:dephospho-CoA kinase [Clostridia bacterium]